MTRSTARRLAAASLAVAAALVGLPAGASAAAAATSGMSGLPTMPAFPSPTLPEPPDIQLPGRTSSTASTGLSTGSSTDRGAGSGSPTTTTVTPAASTGARVYLDLLTPIASPTVSPVIRGRVTLPAGMTVTDLRVRISIDRAVTRRADLDRLRANPDSVRYSASELATLPVTSPDGEFVFSEPLDITRPPTSAVSVYPLKISAEGSVNGRRTELAATHSFLVWAPSAAQGTAGTTASGVAPTGVTVVLPLADRPRLRSDGLLTDNELAGLIAPGGRLYELLAAVVQAGEQPSPIALAVDPTLLQALEVMASGPYEYATPSGPQRAEASTQAADFLDALRDFAQTPGNTVFALPWGDADITAIVRANRLDVAHYAVNTGREVVAGLLDDGDTGDDLLVAYPADGLADAGALAFLADENIGMSTVIIDDRLLPKSGGAGAATPTALAMEQTSSGNAVRLLAADSTLRDIVVTPTSGAGAGSGGPSAAQSLGDVFAELAMITNERPAQQRSVVLALPRDWDPEPEWARLLLRWLTAPADAGYQPFFQPATLSSALAGQPAGSARGPFNYPEWALEAEIPTSYVDAVQELRDEALALHSVLCPLPAGQQPGGAQVGPAPPSATCPNGQHPLAKSMSDVLLSAMSVAFRTNRPGAVTLSQEVDGAMTELRDGIQVVASPKVTLTSRTGRVPLTIQNNNDYPVTVTLSLSSNDRTRLRSPTRVTRPVAAHGVDQVEVEVSTDAAGTFPLYVELYTPDGERLSSRPTRILVRSTAYGTIATIITIGAIGLLVFAVALRWIRRIRGGGKPTEQTEQTEQTGVEPAGAEPAGTGVAAAGLTGVEPAGAGQSTATGHAPPAPAGATPADQAGVSLATVAQPPQSGQAAGNEPDSVPDTATTPLRRIQASASGAQRSKAEPAYAGWVPATPTSAPTETAPTTTAPSADTHSLRRRSTP